MHILQISAAVCCFVSLLLLLISLGSNHWSEGNGFHSGLWENCTVSPCETVKNPSDKLNASRAFMLLGMLSGAVSLFGLCATFFQSHVCSISMAKLAALASLSAGLCAMIAMSIFTADTSGYGWSFGLGWASFPLFLITSGLAFVFLTSTAE